MRMTASVVLCATIGAAGCASTPTQPLREPAADARALVLVFREPAFAAGGVSLSVGVDGKRFVNLDNGEKSVARISAGTHEILVQARSAEPTRLQITADKQQQICLRTSASPGTYAKAALPPVLMITGYHFYLDQVPCPDAAELSKYKDIPVAYQ